MLRLLDVKYNFLSELNSQDLFSLRKKVFKDRLNWMVTAENEMESDQYDNPRTTYIFGIYKESCICSLRFIEIKYPNMITGTFKSWFKNSELPEGNYVEASRLFIDKERVQTQALSQQPVSALLFLSMINYARHYGYEGIYAIVSHPMYVIFKKSGWKVSVVEQATSEKQENIYLIFMPVDAGNQQTLMRLVKTKVPSSGCELDEWPLSFPVRKHRTDQV
ncbi:acyl-homoserine-lactone synthase [Erwinia sp.]|uniref:acyl-homoserine-lactone synthase n=1 Tax=Erwinia citreus TaxID=558 RepID=UPI003C76ABCC